MQITFFINCAVCFVEIPKKTRLKSSVLPKEKIICLATISVLK